MKQAEQLMVVNPMIEQYRKRYIFGTDNNAARIFTELCTRRIYIDGFIDDQNDGIYFFHKPVYAKNKLIAEQDSFIVLACGIPDEIEDCQVCSEIFVINPKLQEKKIMIYGGGNVGKYVFSILETAGKEIVGFIDSDERKAGGLLFGLNIYGKEKIYSLSDDIVIVEAGKGCHEIEDAIKTINQDLKRFYISEIPMSSYYTIWVDRKDGHSVELQWIVKLGEYYKHEGIEEIILYGNDLPLAQKYMEVYDCLDFGPLSFMIDKRCATEHDIPVVEEIIYKERYLLMLYDKHENYSLKKLSDLGVDKRSILIHPFSSPIFNSRNVLLDVNLGNTYEMNFMYPGIYVYGKNQRTDYKIAVLGGSTTDSMFDTNIRSWAEIMYDKYCKTGITVFNGGIISYNSSQELIKLIRDILKLEPDMIIVYDGFNDIIQDEKFKYLGDLVDFACEHISVLCNEEIEKKRACRGIPAKGNCIDVWLENIESMYAIAKSRNIKFFSFMQPMLFTKKRMDLHSKTISKTPSFFSKDFLNLAWQFRERAAEIENTHNYIYDLTYIFDDVDVYMDICHVYERGNGIIAEAVWKTIENHVLVSNA